MATSYVTYTGDGATTNYAVPFTFINRTHVTATVDGVSAAFTWNSDAQINITSAPANASYVKIARTTPTTPIVDFTNGSTLVADDLDTATRQSIFVSAEAEDRAADTISLAADNKWDGQTKVIKNVTDPTNAQDAATKSWVDSQVSALNPDTVTAAAATATTQAGIATAQAAIASTKAAEAAASAASASPGASVGLVLALGG